MTVIKEPVLEKDLTESPELNEYMQEKFQSYLKNNKLEDLFPQLLKTVKLFSYTHGSQAVLPVLIESFAYCFCALMAELSLNDENDDKAFAMITALKSDIDDNFITHIHNFRDAIKEEQNEPEKK